MYTQTLITHSSKGVEFLNYPLPPRSYTSHYTLTADWLTHFGSNQGPDYNHVHQIPAHHWATQIDKGNKLGSHLKYYLTFKKGH